MIQTGALGGQEKIGPGAGNQRDGHVIGKAELERAIWPGLPKAKATSAIRSQIDLHKVNLNLLLVTHLNWIILRLDYPRKAAPRQNAVL